MNVKDVTTQRFEDEVIARSRTVPVVVDFWAAWCGPCRVLGPILERLAAESGGRWELAKVDVDANPELAGRFGVQGIPTVIGFRDGKPVARFTGAIPEDQVRVFLDRLVPSDLDLKARAGADAYAAGDEETAERLWRQVLEQEPDHLGAGVGMAALLIARGESEAALELLGRLPPSDEVRRLQARARLSQGGDLEELERRAASGDPEARLAYGKALAAAHRHPEALEVLLGVAAEKTEEVSEQARQAMVDLFELLGPDHPLTLEYRRKLASVLF
ncbi:MAG: co-chaperone YbbN [Acidimicrobiia bacterium]|nr:MAG: co-chaperone YbbN [Acidimicrobiia bacterium]